MSKKRRITLPTDNRHQDVVHSGQQQRIENQPRLPEKRGSVSPPHRGPTQLSSKGSPPPQLAEVGNQRGQAGPVRSVVVVDRLELRITGTAHPTPALTSAAALPSAASHRHSRTVISMPMASDLSYLHLSLFFGLTQVWARWQRPRMNSLPCSGPENCPSDVDYEDRLA
jgi:hypothetical protein